MIPQAPKITPPFAWAGRHIMPIALGAVVAAAAFLRLFQLTSLPPGVDAASAQVGNQVRVLLELHTWPALTATNYYSPLWLLLQASAIWLFGHTQLALLIWPALLGIAAVATTWLWARCWFDTTVAWLAAFLLAVTPWAMSLSRVGTPYAVYPFLITLTLWLAARYWRSHSVTDAVAVGGALLLDSLAGPLGWLTVCLVCATAAYLYLTNRRRVEWQRSAVLLVVFGALSLAVIAYTVLLARHSLAHVGHDLGLAGSLAQLGSSILATLLMFNAVGDPDFVHNLAGSPQLNSFVGLMFIAGLLVAVSRIHQRRYRMFLLCLLVLPVPTLITATDAPNSFTAAAALPLVVATAAIGVAYMLELWYKTFPINSAARTTGQAAIAVLLLLSLLEGYTQYFHAWAAADGAYTAFNNGPSLMAKDLIASGNLAHKPGDTYVVANSAQQAVIDYLAKGKISYHIIAAAQIAALSTSGTKQFWITADQESSAVAYLRQHFPGALLQPQYSTFSQSEIYYTYQVTK